MNFQETIETISKRKMTEQEAFEFCRDQWGMVCSWLKSRLDFGTILIESNKKQGDKAKKLLRSLGKHQYD